MDYEKGVLRAKVRAARRGIRSNFDPNELSSTDEFKSSKVIASYRSYGDEPSTLALNLAILTSGKKLLLPRVVSPKQIEFVEWTGDVNQLISNGKVEEPIGPAFTGRIDMMIIPSLAVDRSGVRLGQGGGFYDRALSAIKSWKVTLLNEGEFLDEVPRDSHDQKVDAVLLPGRLIRI